MTQNIVLTGKERFFGDDDLIVSKTDLKGRISYANKSFLEIADFQEEEVLGQPHKMIRHPEMPRCVFKLLWDTIQSGEEIFAYVINRTKFGDHYWVFAHVTPSLDSSGLVCGFHSNRRVPNRKTLQNVIQPLYRDLHAAENRSAGRRDGLAASSAMMSEVLMARGLAYDEFILGL